MQETQEIVQSLSSLSYLGVLGFAFLANLFPGIPEEVFLLVFGYISRGEDFSLLWVTIFLILGFVVMDGFLYLLSKKGNKRLIFLKNKILGSEKQKSQLVFIKRHINYIIFFSRFVLFFRWIGPLMAGVVKVPYKRFLLIDITALVVYVPLMLFLGRYFHARINKIIQGVHVFGNYVMIFSVIGLVILLALYLKKYFLNYMRSK